MKLKGFALTWLLNSRRVFSTTTFLGITIFMLVSFFGCKDQAARSADDIFICRNFFGEALMRMDELKREVFTPGDLTFESLRHLTPRDPDWRDAQFLVLNNAWNQREKKKIVIVCGQSRVKNGERVHCVGYNTGDVVWISEDQIGKLQLRDFSVLPKIRP
ncbi:MAG: hypothetical protein ABJC04_01320 [Verrucomicrobiota bacterium]